MKKFLVHLLCAFIPFRKLRRNTRNHFLPMPTPMPLIVHDIRDIRDVHDVHGINIGGGRWSMPGWINVDLYIPEEFSDIKIDLLKQQRLPIASNSMRVAFCSHLIEHLTDDNDMNLFREIFRILGDGGVFRVSCPSADKALAAYSKGETEFFFNDDGGVMLIGDTTERRLVNFFASFRCKDYKGFDDYIGGPIVDDKEVKQAFETKSADEFIKWCADLIPADAYYTAHINGFYAEKLKFMLEKAGFSCVMESEYKQSMLRELRMDRFDGRPEMSMFVECIKYGVI
jgi:SAM-dependent methyltransferase